MNNKPKNKLKILVAEDDMINRKLFTYILKEISDDLILTENGSEAVKKHNETPDIDLILMDLKMPEMGGYEATKIIRKQDNDIPIIALSAFAFDTEINKALANGFNAYVSKPINKGELFKTIGSFFEL